MEHRVITIFCVLGPELVYPEERGYTPHHFFSLTESFSYIKWWSGAEYRIYYVLIWNQNPWIPVTLVYESNVTVTILLSTNHIHVHMGKTKTEIYNPYIQCMLTKLYSLHLKTFYFLSPEIIRKLQNEEQHSPNITRLPRLSFSVPYALLYK